eukprot:gene17513-20893_t
MPEIKDDYDRAKFALVQDFPMCFQSINAAFECDKSMSLPPGARSKQCQYEHAHLQFCMLSTFCPKQATELLNCMDGKIPQDGIPVPRKCQDYWNRFDQCLIDKTDDFERMEKNKASTTL